MKKIIKKHLTKLIVLNTVLGTFLFIYLFYFNGMINLQSQHSKGYQYDPFFYLSICFSLAISLWINKQIFKKR